METEILDPNAIATAAAANSGIINTTWVYDYYDRDAPTLIFKTNLTHEVESEPAPEEELDDEHEENDNNDDEDYDDDNDKLE